MDLSGLSKAYEKEIEYSPSEVRTNEVETKDLKKTKTLDFSGLSEAYENEIKCSISSVRTIHEVKTRKIKNNATSKPTPLPGNKIETSQPKRIERTEPRKTDTEFDEERLWLILLCCPCVVLYKCCKCLKCLFKICYHAMEWFIENIILRLCLILCCPFLCLCPCMVSKKYSWCYQCGIDENCYDGA